MDSPVVRLHGREPCAIIRDQCLLPRAGEYRPKSICAGVTSDVALARFQKPPPTRPVPPRVPGLGLVSTKISKPRRADLPEPSYLTAEVALLSDRTPYMILGDLFAWVCVFLSMFWIDPGLIRRR